LYQNCRKKLADAAVNQQIAEPTAESPTEIQAEPPVRSAQDVVRPLEDRTREFDFWEDLRESMPPWINEVVGFALIIFGVLSFISLYIASDALVAVTWADMLTALFGEGAIFVAGAIFAFGVVLWLPKAGFGIRFSSARLLALEIMFLSILAILHLGNSDSELRALARAGQGGGLIGWGLSYPFYWIAGRPAALVFFSILIGICAIAALGLRRRHLAALLARFGGKLRIFSENSNTAQASSAQADESRTIYQRLVGLPAYRANIMRIRPDPGSIPDKARAHRHASKANDNAIERIRPVRSTQANDTERGDAGLDAAAGPGATAREAGYRREQSAVEANAQPEETEPESAPASASELNRQVWLDSLPSIDCLTASDLILPDEDEINHKAMLIQNTLLEFDLETTVIDVQVGPTVTRYAVQPHKEDGSDRIRMSRIASYARDLSLALAAKRLRMETPVPGTNYMGIEVPNKEPSIVALRNVLVSEEYKHERASSRAPLLIPLGRTVTGEAIAIDLAQMPHLLIAGTTGSGKSVCMGAIATSLLMQCSPSELRMVMLDPKMVELSRFDGIPHLLGPVEIKPERIIGVLRWCTREMDRRYQLLEEGGARNITMFNEAQLARGNTAETLPYIVILIDEIGDLMLRNPDETERALTRLAQMARAVGMHLVVATQRPSVDVITGLIKANFPSRIAFSVASGADSRVIIDRAGAEHLLGGGDMLFLSADAAAPQRIQGCFVSEEDTRVVVEHWKAEQAELGETRAAPAKGAGPWEQDLLRRQFIADTDPMLEDVLKLAVKNKEVSASLIQRRLGLGYPRAARIMDLLEELGLVGEELGGGRSRTVIIPPNADPVQFAFERYMATRS
jgi:S-DNA-T family DNA segregation ATPase FtsK/SpoIIIE